MTLEEIKEEHPDKWVLVKVIHETHKGTIKEAEVLFVSEDRDAMYEAMNTVGDGEHVATLFTGEILKEDEAFAF